MGRGSLGAQQGMRAATATQAEEAATQAEEAALRNHPETTTHIADHELTGKQKTRLGKNGLPRTDRCRTDSSG